MFYCKFGATGTGGELKMTPVRDKNCGKENEQIYFCIIEHGLVLVWSVYNQFTIGYYVS